MNSRESFVSRLRAAMARAFFFADTGAARTFFVAVMALFLLGLAAPRHAEAQTYYWGRISPLAIDGCTSTNCPSPMAACQAYLDENGGASAHENIIAFGPVKPGEYGCQVGTVSGGYGPVFLSCPVGYSMDPNSGVGCDQYQNQVQPPQLLGSGSGCGSCDVPPAGQSDDSVGGNNADPSQLVTNYGSLSIGPPVNVATGNVFYQVTDYETAGQNPLRFTRYYNSRGTAFTGLGANWYSNFSSSALTVTSGQVLLYRATGQILTFNQSGSTWATDTDMDVTMTMTGTTATFKDHDDTVEVYTSGLLTTRTFRNGYTQTMHYTSGRLSSVTDTYGRALTFTWNSDNATLASVGTPDGTTISYGYTVSSGGKNLTSVTYPTSPATSVTYSYGSGTLNSALTQLTDEAGNNFLSWTYDAYGRALTSQKGNGSTANVTTFVYNDSAATTTVTNTLGVADTYTLATYAGIPKIVGISRAATSTTAAATESFTYDGYAGVSCSTAGNTGYMCSRTDWNGNKTAFTRNSYGNLTQIVEASGSSVARTTTIAYDTSCVRQPDSIATTGVTTSFTYDGNCEALTQKLADTTTQTVPYSTNGTTRTWTYTYASSLLATVKTPNLHTTTLGYDASGALTSIENALSQTTSVTSHTGGGLPLTIVDPNSVTTTKTYDGRQRLQTSAISTTAGVLTTTWQYSTNGDVRISLPDGSGGITLLDSAHRLTGFANTASEQNDLNLDSNGDPVTVTYFNPSGTVTFTRSATFDALGRKLKDTSAVTGQSYVRTFDHNGNTLTIEDPLSHTTTNVYDALNRLSKSTDANTGIVQYTFDAHNRPLTVEDKNSHTTGFVYDGFGDVIQQTSPDTGTTVYHYDSDGNLTSKTDAASVVTNLTYDALDRLLTRSYPSDSTANVSFTYDQVSAGFGFSIGHLTTATDATGTHLHKYDERGNVLIQDLYSTAGTMLEATVYNYDNASRIASIQYPSGSLVTYGRDAVGRITSITTKAPGSTAVTLMSSITYEPFGPLLSDTAFNGDTETFTFDKDYRMETLVTSSTNGSQNQSFAYDNANNLHTLTDSVCTSCSATYSYDSINRLLTASSWYGSFAYTYDKNGNFLTNNEEGEAGTYTIASGSNRVTSIAVGGTSYPVAYNSDGNIASFTRFTGETTSFTYNGANQMKTASLGTPATFVYDVFGHRYSKATSSATTIYHYDLNNNMIGEQSGTTYHDYVFLGNRVVGALTPSSNTLAFTHGDKLAAAADSTDATAKISQAISYTPYQNTSAPYQQSGAATIVQNNRAVGQVFDTETLMNHNGFRDYSPSMGRYVEADPTGLNGGLNLYAYAANNPISYVDPSGLASVMSIFQNPQYWSQIYGMAGNVYANGRGYSLVCVSACCCSITYIGGVHEDRIRINESVRSESSRRRI